VNARNIPVKLATPAQKLIQNPITKEIVGVQAVDWKGETLYVQANKGVILACGGYENNQEMRTNFLPWANSNEPFITFGGTPYNTGDGIIMAQSVGAKLWHMNNKEWGEPLTHPRRRAKNSEWEFRYPPPVATLPSS